MFPNSQFLRGHNDVTDQFSEIQKSNETKGLNKKLGKSVRNDVWKKFFTNRVVDMWNRIRKEKLNVDNAWEIFFISIYLIAFPLLRSERQLIIKK